MKELTLNEERDTAERVEKALTAMSCSSPTAGHIEVLQAARMAAQRGGAQPTLSSEGAINNARAEANIQLGAVQQAMATSDPQLSVKINAALAAVRGWKNLLPRPVMPGGE
jgi:hypothetical protein